MRATHFLFSVLGATLISAGTVVVHAADDPYYNPTNKASPSGFTTDYEAFRTIGCPGQPLLGSPCKVPDSDGDGVFDNMDKCPDTPAGRKVNAQGCELDGDGDGVVDGLDKCPNTPPGRKVNAQGCELDSDGDGVVDGLDKCPNTPAGRKVNAQGCELDSDGDGVVDGLDKCPGTPAGVQVDSKGCPLDSDGDGVTDNLDQCPGTPAGVKVNAQGCPPVAEKATVVEEVVVEKLVLQGINFDSESDKITTQFDPVLDKAAAALNSPAWQNVKVEVGGYCDYLGTDEFNLKLSERRANAVRDYLISKGIAADRLTAKGYGKANPIADNATPEGRFQNRRVELVPMK